MKVKSLAVEAAIIRTEEDRALRRKDAELYASLRDHRRRDARQEQRSALLAYAFLRCRDYSRCERPAKDNPPDLKRVAQLVEKFGTPIRGYPAFKLPAGVLEKWVAGTLEAHPFATPTRL